MHLVLPSSFISGKRHPSSLEELQGGMCAGGDREGSAATLLIAGPVLWACCSIVLGGGIFLPSFFFFLDTI